MFKHTVASLPEPHRQFIERAVGLLAADPRIAGVAVAGSYLDDTLDEFSDLDLVIGIEPVHLPAVMQERERIAASLGSLPT
jgi:hypothetical protein